MRQVRSVTGRRRCTLGVMAIAAVSVVALALSACGTGTAPPPVQVIADKGDPFGDLLVPRLQSSVTDGAVGVPVGGPVTPASDSTTLAIACSH